MEIREQRAEDLDEVLALTRLTFGDEGDDVAAIVRLQVEEPVYGSRGWIALDGDRIIGHVALTDGWIDAVRRLVSVPVLSPLTVHPQHQGSGIGGALIAYAVAAADAAGAPAVVLEGDPGYYSRHGFEATVDRGSCVRPPPSPRRLSSGCGWRHTRPGCADGSSIRTCSGAVALWGCGTNARRGRPGLR